ncbi:MAG TPA: excinuclease ABC subunit UvrC [Thermoplasmata archaeon]|nr:excinuclease ABC subunit UvrC [Thermoplasmata archaeon]
MTGGPTDLPGFVPASRLAASEGEGFRKGPTGPGVYLFRSARGEVIYVGKSRNLRRRVLDHLHARVEKDGSILAQSASVEFVPTENEREALLLEASLIKRHQPPYNTLLKDDRSYPYVAVTLSEEYPRILFVRRPRRRTNDLLFGPYTSARETRTLAKVLSETFRVRQCIRLPKKACLYYHLGTCTAPCIAAVGPEAYRAQVDQAVGVLKGHGAKLLPAVESEMRLAAANLEFERAGVLRDALQGMAAMRERQQVVGPGTLSYDALGVAFPTDPSVLRVAVGVARIEEGEVRGTEPHLLAYPADDVPDRGEVLRQFLAQYYADQLGGPTRIYVDGPRPTGVDEITELLEENRGISVKFRPTGRPAGHARFAARLAQATVEQVVVRKPPTEVLDALQTLLRLPTRPNRIEGVDISIFQGWEGVGSLVVFRGGVPAKSEYRRFKVRGIPGTNDFAMVRQVVLRRYSRRLAEQEILPDLLLIDGGRGQLSSAMDALKELGLDEQIPTIGLAKREEEIYRPEEATPLKPNPSGPPMLLLRAVRDEAHRFAVTYHRTRRRIRLREEVEAARSADDAS